MKPTIAQTNESEYLKFRWYVLITLFIASIAQSMILISPAPLVGAMSESLGLNLGEVTGAAMGSFTLFVALSAIAGGIIMDKIGMVKTYFISLALMIIGSLLIPVLGGTISGLLAARVIQGCGAGPILASTSRIAAEWFPTKERAIVTGLQGAGVSMGIAIGFGLAPALYDQTSNWQVAIAWMAIGSVISVVLTAIIAFGPKSPVEQLDEEDASDLIRSSEEYKISVKLPVFWVGIISVFFLSWSLQGYNDLTPGHLAIEEPMGLGLGPVLAGRYMGLFQIAFMVGSVASGFLVKRIFYSRHKILISCSFILTGLFCVSVLLPLTHANTTLLMLCLLAAGFFMGMPIPVVLAFISSFYPEHITGRVGGATMGLGIFGGVAGVAAGSYALHHSGMYTISIMIVGIVCILGAINAFGLNPPKAFAYLHSS